MYRPWDQDEEPVFRAQCVHVLTGPLHPEDRARLLATLATTGLVRQPAVLPTAGAVTLRALVRAPSAAAAPRRLCRIGEVVCRVAGVEVVGRRSGLLAVRRPE